MGVALLFFVGTLDSLAVPADTSHAAVSPSQVAEATSHSAESPWTVSASTTVYFGHTVDVYAVPDITVEYHALHVEGRYNYEALHATSVLLGWHFAFGDDEAGLDVTPMAGYVTGSTNGPAPLPPFCLMLDWEDSNSPMSASMFSRRMMPGSSTTVRTSSIVSPQPCLPGSWASTRSVLPSANSFPDCWSAHRTLDSRQRFTYSAPDKKR